jgi:hypothetical protein
MVKLFNIVLFVISFFVVVSPVDACMGQPTIRYGEWEIPLPQASSQASFFRLGEEGKVERLSHGGTRGAVKVVRERRPGLPDLITIYSNGAVAARAEYVPSRGGCDMISVEKTE